MLRIIPFFRNSRSSENQFSSALSFMIKLAQRRLFGSKFPIVLLVVLEKSDPPWRLMASGAIRRDPPSRRKIREELLKQWVGLFASVIKILSTFKANFETISSGGLSRDYYWRSGKQEFHDFRGFASIAWYSFMKLFLLSSCFRHQKCVYVFIYFKSIHIFTIEERILWNLC